MQHLKKSIIIAAHPDDEILWFSSILNKVDQIIFCYHGKKDDAFLTNGRSHLLQQYPFQSITTLNITESDVYKEKQFTFPIETRYGLLAFNLQKNIRYQANFSVLEKKLIPILAHFNHVFSHNPWGEYGHEEHVQVYRVLKKLQEQMEFNLYFDNYISGKTLRLGKRYLFKYHYPWFSCPVNENIYQQLMPLYIKNNCWTWPEDWCCFKDEAFLKDEIKKKPLGKYDHLPPLNIIRH
jgi:hypothetical protein